MAGTLKKVVIRGSRGIKYLKLGFWGIITDTDHRKFLIFCLMVEGDRLHHLSVVLYLGKS